MLSFSFDYFLNLLCYSLVLFPSYLLSYQEAIISQSMSYFGKYNFMLDQQLNITGRQLQKEAEVNWSCYRNLYIQSGKTNSSPEPDFSDRFPTEWIKNMETSMKDYFEQMCHKLSENNKEQIVYIEGRYREEIGDLKKRIERLQEIILNFKITDYSPSANNRSQKYQTPRQDSFGKKTTELDSTQTKVKQNKPYIHIQQEQHNEDVSLLDPTQQPLFKDDIQRKKQQNQLKSRKKQDNLKRQQQWREGIKRKLYQSPLHSSVKREVINNSKQVIITKQPIIIPDIIINDNYFQPNYKSQKFINVPCRVHDKILSQLREEVQRLRDYLRTAHNEEIQEPLVNSKIVELRAREQQYNNNPTFLLNLSLNSQRHLQHQNSKLRQINESYLEELKSARKETRSIKNLLKGVLQISNHIYK